MAPIISAAIGSKKRKRVLDMGGLKDFLDTIPDDYEFAWNELERRIVALDEHAQHTAPSLNLSQQLYYW